MTEDEDRKEEKEPEFSNLNDRRQYFQDHPELFPPLARKMLLLRPPYKQGVSWLAYHLAKDIETRHDAHWQLQTYLLMDISEKLEKLVKLLSNGAKKKVQKDSAQNSLSKRKGIKL